MVLFMSLPSQTDHVSKARVGFWEHLHKFLKSFAMCWQNRAETGSLAGKEENQHFSLGKIGNIDLCDNFRWMIKFGLLGPQLKIQFKWLAFFSYTA